MVNGEEEPEEMACVLIPPRVIDKRLPGTSAEYLVNKRYASQKCKSQEKAYVKEEKLADRSMRSTRCNATCKERTRIELQFFTSSVIVLLFSPLACHSPLCLL